MQQVLTLSVILMLSHANAISAQPASQLWDKHFSSFESRSTLTKATQPTVARKEYSIDSSGYIYDSGYLHGQIDHSGYVRDPYGSIIGQIDSTGYIYSASGSIIGQVDSVGYIYSANGEILGRYASNGDVRDADGNLIATVADRNLVLFLLFFQQ